MDAVLAALALAAMFAFVAYEAVRNERANELARGNYGSPSPAPAPEHGDEYEPRATLLTPTEQRFQSLIVQAVPQLTIAPQVQVSQVVRPVKSSRYQAALNRIDRKSLDFVLLDADSAIVAAIELDDRSHDNVRRQQADAVKDAAMASAGVPLLRYRAERMPTPDTIAADLEQARRARSHSH